MDGSPIDAADLRNLLHEVGGDPRSYVAELVRRTGGVS
jgi:hypothetical protein